MRRAPICSYDMTMISSFNITINIIVITDPTFSRSFSNHKFFVKRFFHDFTTVPAFFDHTINKIVNIISPRYD